MPITIDPSAPFTCVPFNKLPNATATSYHHYIPIPTAEGTRDDCVHYFAGDDYQMDLNGLYWESPCHLVAYMYDVDLESFEAWNPGLGNVSLPSCKFEKDVRYCGSWYLQKPASTETVTATSSTATISGTPGPTPPAPTHTGPPANCKTWDVVEDGDSCTSMASEAGISPAQFLDWNPAVSSDCLENFWLGYAYCVGVTGTATTVTRTPSSTAAPPTVTTPPAQYLQEGQPSNCIEWDCAISGDYCGLPAPRNGLTVSQLAAMNPALGEDGAGCASMVWLDYHYCIETT